MTVIPPELHALQRALKIDIRKNRVYTDSGIFFTATVHSEVMDRDVSVIVGCIGEASQGNAAAMTMHIIEKFEPRMVILVGIAAGMRGKLKIGDVVVPREVADLSVCVARRTDQTSAPRGSQPSDKVLTLDSTF